MSSPVAAVQDMSSLLAAEQLVVAAVINSAQQFEVVSQIIGSSDFTDETMRLLWDTVAVFREEGKPIDMPILAMAMEKSKRWKALRIKTPPLEYIAALCEVTCAYSNTKTYAESIKNASVDRQLLDFTESVKDVVYSGEVTEADEKLATVHSLLEPLSNEQPSGFITAKDAGFNTVKLIIDQHERGSAMAGLPTGFRDIDARLGGLMDSDLILVAGRPSQGKTTYAMNIATNIAKDKPVQVFSLEMPYEQLMKRMISQFSGINLRDIIRANLDEQSTSRLFVAGKKIAEMRMMIDDQGGLSVDQLMMRSRIEARKERPGAIVVDYLQLLGGKGETRNLEIGYVSRRLKQLAKEMKCPVICLSQLNRNLEQRPNKRPMMADLRDSGSLEQDADVIQFIYRDEVYNGDDSDLPGITEIITEKFRNGEPGTDYLETQLEYSRFADMSGPLPEPKERKPSSSPSNNLTNILNGNSNSALHDMRTFS